MNCGNWNNVKTVQTNRILFWLKHYQAAQMLDDCDRLRFYESIMEYAFFGYQPDYLESEDKKDEQVKMAFLFVQHQIDRSIKNIIESDAKNEKKKNKEKG